MCYLFVIFTYVNNFYTDIIEFLRILVHVNYKIMLFRYYS